MPYTEKNYPDSMKNLPDEIRKKAVEILNALLEERKMKIDIAIPTSISRAKDWAKNRGKKITETKTDQKRHGEDLYIMYRDDKWVVKKEKAERASFTFRTKDDAVKKGKEMSAENNVSLTIIGRDGKIQSKI